MKAAKILRDNVHTFEKSRQFEFPTSLVPGVEDVTPQLYTFCKLLIAGTKRDFMPNKRQHVIEVAGVTQALNVTYAMKTDRQISHEPNAQDAGFRTIGKDNRQTFAVGIMAV